MVSRSINCCTSRFHVPLIQCAFGFQEEEQKHLEEEMQKRRERIEKWRTERKRQNDLVPFDSSLPAKLWTLDNDEDEDEDEMKNNAMDANLDIDPLDAYMMVKYCFLSGFCESLSRIFLLGDFSMWELYAEGIDVKTVIFQLIMMLMSFLCYIDHSGIMKCMVNWG